MAHARLTADGCWWGAGTLQSNAYEGTINYGLFYSDVKSAKDVLNISNYINAHVSTRSGYPVPTINSSSTSQLVLVGDSIIAGFNAGGTFLQNQIVTNSTYLISNFGIAGMSAASTAALGSERHLQIYAANAVSNKLIIEPGTNDVCVIGHTPAQAWSDIEKIGLAAKAVGFKTILSTMISRDNCSARLTQKSAQ